MFIFIVFLFVFLVVCFFVFCFCFFGDVFHFLCVFFGGSKSINSFSLLNICFQFLTRGSWFLGFLGLDCCNCLVMFFGCFWDVFGCWVYAGLISESLRHFCLGISLFL